MADGSHHRQRAGWRFGLTSWMVFGGAFVIVLVAIALGVRSFAAQAKPAKLSNSELIARVARAPERAPDFSATVNFQQSVLPAQLLGATEQGNGSPNSGARTVRLWYGGKDRLRVELQGASGDRVLVENGRRTYSYNGSTNTLRVGRGVTRPSPSKDVLTNPAKVNELLRKLAPTSTLTQKPPVEVAGRPAYVLDLSPRDKASTLVDHAQVLIDSKTYVPLGFSLYAKGRPPSAVLSWRATSFNVGRVPADLFQFHSPPGARVEKASSPQKEEHGRNGEARPAEVGTVAQAQKRVGFPVKQLPNAPGGRTLTSVHLMGSDGVVLTYGSGWNTMVLSEEHSRRNPNNAQISKLRLPTVNLGGGVKAQELSTPIGTVLHWKEGKVVYTLAGSVPASRLQQLAGGLR